MISPTKGIHIYVFIKFFLDSENPLKDEGNNFWLVDFMLHLHPG